MNAQGKKYAADVMKSLCVLAGTSAVFGAAVSYWTRPEEKVAPVVVAISGVFTSAVIYFVYHRKIRREKNA